MANVIQTLARRQAEGKALAAHPVFLDRTTPTSVYSPGQKSDRPVLSQREAGRHLDAYGGNQTIDWVVDGVRLYQDTASAAAWHLESKGERLYAERTDDTPPGASLAPPDLLRLMTQPNPFMAYDEMIELLVIDLLLVGNGYWLKDGGTPGRPTNLFRLHPAYIKVRPGQIGVEKYIWHPPNASEPQEFTPDRIVHFKLPNPNSAYYGLGIIKSGGRPLDLELALADSQAHYFENKADPSMIVTSERRVPRDVFNKLRAQVRARSMGTDKAGDLLVLESGLKASTLTPSARDAMYAELGDKSRDRILALLRVHPKLLGVTPEAAGEDKIQDVRREFDNKTMRPFLDKLERAITRGVSKPGWQLDFKIDYRYVMPAEDAIKLSSDLGSVPGIMVKEVRGFLVEAGLIDEASTGDIEIDETVLNLPGEELDETGQGGFADRPLPREAGRPPLGENTRAFPRNGSLPAGSKARQAGKAMSIEQIEDRLRLIAAGEGKAVRAEEPKPITLGNKLPDEQRPIDVLAGRRSADLDAVIRTMRSDLAGAAHNLERGLLDKSEGKAFDPKTYVTKVRNAPVWDAFRSEVTTILERSARAALSTAAIHQGTQGREAELDYDAIAGELVNRRTGARAIVANLKESVTKRLQETQRKDATLPDVQKTIQERIALWRDSQAETIAMTEAVHAYNEGTLSVFEATGVETVFVSDGDDHDEPCTQANGSLWDLKTARENRLEHPRCRRAFLAFESVS